MTKLHKILMRHAGPKSQVEFTLKYVLADSEQVILNHLNSKDDYTFGGWLDRGEFDEENDEPDELGADGKKLFPIYDNDYNKVGTETYLERMLRLRGELNDENADWDDAYYGIKHYGWDEGAEIAPIDAATLLRLGIAEDWRVAP